MKNFTTLENTVYFIQLTQNWMYLKSKITYDLDYDR